MKKSAGFTLIEILVVIAIIAILAAILFPVFERAKESAKKTVDLSNMKQVIMAAHMYANDKDDEQMHGEGEPWETPGWTLFVTAYERLNPYVKNTEIWIAPGSSTSAKAYANVSEDCLLDGGGLTPKVVSNYVNFDWIFPAFWNITPLFPIVRENIWFGFPNPCSKKILSAGPAYNCGYPPDSFAHCEDFQRFGTAICGMGFTKVEHPAETAVYIRGAAVSYTSTAGPASTLKFGSSCGTSFGGDFKKKDYFPFAEGFNIAMADGHARYVKGKAFFTDTSLRLITTARHTPVPVNRFTRFKF